LPFAPEQKPSAGAEAGLSSITAPKCCHTAPAGRVK
jgi:hypothetical protein